MGLFSNFLFIFFKKIFSNKTYYIYNICLEFIEYSCFYITAVARSHSLLMFTFAPLRVICGKGGYVTDQSVKELGPCPLTARGSLVLLSMVSFDLQRCTGNE